VSEAETITVTYFAAARELAGTSEERVALEAEQLSAAVLMERLGARHSRLAPLIHRMRLAVNGEVVDSDARVTAGDEVAVLPPVAGGSAATMLCEVRDRPLSVDEAMAAVRQDRAGAIAVFIGVVRDHADGKDVARLDYEAHATMAVKEMARVLEELAAEYPEVKLAAVHRVGELAVGDLAVVVATSAAHRAEAFDSCRKAIERIKERVPIWKKEWAPDGSAHWVNLEPDPK